MSSAALPTVTSPVAPDLRRYLDRLRDILGAKGTNKIITVSDLVAAGMVTANSDGSISPTPGAGGGTVAAPGSPSGLTATAAMRSILLEWGNPTYAGHAFTEVWGHSADVIGDAVLLGLAPGVLYTDSVGPGVHRYYWVRFVNQDGAAGPFNAVGGTDATTLPELTTLLDVLAEEYGTSSAAPFFQLDAPTVIGGVSIPAGTYMKAAFIHDAAIDNAKIGDLAVDNAKIADLAADKITAGSLQVGSYVQSTSYTPGSAGWRIDADGTAEFSDVVVRGTVYATDGQFTGEVIAASPSGDMARMYSGNFELYKNVPAVGLVRYNALTRIETGIAASGAPTDIPGYFRSAPRVIVSPMSLNTYDPGYPSQPQALRCEVTNLVESPSGSFMWQFTPAAELRIADTSVWVANGASSGDTTAAWTSPSGDTTVANTVVISAQVSAASRRATGATETVLNETTGAYETQYVHHTRAVRSRVEYYDGATWVSGPWTSAALARDTSADATITPSTGAIAAGTYTPRVRCEAADLLSVAGTADWPALPLDGTLWAAPVGTLSFADTARGATAGASDVFGGGGACVSIAGADIRTSADGVTWATVFTAPTHTVLQAATRTSSLYVAVGAKYSGLPYDNTTFIGGVIYTSPDGATWTLAFTGAGAGRFNAVAGSASMIVVVGDNGVTTPGSLTTVVYTSPDGVTWTTTTAATGVYVTMVAAVWTGAQFVAVGDQSVLRSADGLTWTHSGGVVSGSMQDVAGAGANLVAVHTGGGGGVGAHYSTDGGVSWSAGSGLSGAHAVVWDGSRFIATQNGTTSPGYTRVAKVYTSPTGATWADSGVVLPGWRYALALSGTHVVSAAIAPAPWHKFYTPATPPTARDTYTYTGHTYQLGGATVLATGDVSWVAIGE